MLFCWVVRAQFLVDWHPVECSLQRSRLPCRPRWFENLLFHPRNAQESGGNCNKAFRRARFEISITFRVGFFPPFRQKPLTCLRSRTRVRLPTRQVPLPHSGYEILYWNARSGKQVRQNTRDVRWATWTCVLGFPVMGIWEKGSDGTDINAASRFGPPLVSFS